MKELNQHKREWSIDLLRIISMLCIVLLHSGSHGNLLTAYPIHSINHWIVRVFNYGAMVSVNIFVLISGYFLINQRFKLKRLLSIITQVWFYSWIIQIVLIMTTGNNSGKGYTIVELLTAAFPITYRQYWFASAYVGLYLLVPLLNKALTRLSQIEYRRIVILLFILTSVWANVFPLSDVYSLQRGNGVAWFVFLYAYAGYCGLYGSVLNKLKSKQYFLVYFISVCLMVSAYAVITWVVPNNKIFCAYKEDLLALFSRYCSVLNFIGATALFHAFKGVKIANKGIQQAISFIAPLTFGIYLLHDNPHMRDIVWSIMLKTNTIPDDWLAVPTMLCYVIIVFVCCATIECIRRRLFRVWEENSKYNAFLDKVQNKLTLMLDVGKRNK